MTQQSKARADLTTFTPPEHDPLADSRLRPLVERYAALAGVSVEERGPQLLALSLLEEERPFFGNTEEVLVAFAVSALEEHPDAAMAVVGSPFLDQLLAAIRARGARLKMGCVPPGPRPPEPVLSVPVSNASAGDARAKMERHPVGRMLARVVISAGAAVEEHLVESGWLDLATGGGLPAYAAAACDALFDGSLSPARLRAASRNAAPRPKRRREAGALVELMTRDLATRMSSRVERLRAESERTLLMELTRIDRYYHTMLEDAASRRASSDATDAGSTAFDDAARAIETEHARRRAEEERRHQLRVVVHPLQLLEMEMLMQRAQWTLSGESGGRATVTAQRYLARGVEAPWRVWCPSCGGEPGALVLRPDGELHCEGCDTIAVPDDERR